MNEAGAEKVTMFPPPVRTKSSTVSAWAIRGRNRAEARRAVNRALRLAGFPRLIYGIRMFCEIRMCQFGGGVKLGDWADADL